ncbi:thioredoxin domain-containing protein [Streptomyces sp. NPDC001941]|uniref:thioredoxin domain-containing protein n=1 Tax=Streptomyces sp. NPDC001941 TaxID=3154659 RepID=UPI003332CF5D
MTVGTALLVTLVASACGGEAGPSPAPHVSTAAPTAQAAAGQSQLAGLPARMDKDGVTIVVGEPAAPHTMRILEDPRSPHCAVFATAAGAEVARRAAAGELKVEYVIASFLDSNLGGKGSLRAANALRASVEAGNFAAYHAALFASQPKETVDGFTTDFLLDVAGKVRGLRSSAFDQAVRSLAYRSWVTKAQKAFRGSGVQGAPTVLVDGEPLAPASARDDAKEFVRALERVLPG